MEFRGLKRSVEWLARGRRPGLQVSQGGWWQQRDVCAGGLGASVGLPSPPWGGSPVPSSALLLALVPPPGWLPPHCVVLTAVLVGGAHVSPSWPSSLHGRLACCPTSQTFVLNKVAVSPLRTPFLKSGASSPRTQFEPRPCGDGSSGNVRACGRPVLRSYIPWVSDPLFPKHGR